MSAADDVAVRFAAGDPDAVREVYRRYGRLMFAAAYHVLGNQQLAEDATQQAFLQAWRAAGRLDTARDMGAWLATIARRAAIDVYRRERRHDRLDDVDPGHPAIVSLPASAESVYELWEVRRALAALPPDDAQLLSWQHYGGLTQNQIAERLRIPIGTVKSRTFRANQRLAQLLGHLRADTVPPAPSRAGEGRRPDRGSPGGGT